MADEPPFKGGRLGPFHLGRRFKHKDFGAGLGRLYEAHNVHTGGPALVLMPDRHADWEPLEEWRISTSSHVSPPYVALEVLHAPASGRLPAVSEQLDLLASALERVEQNAGARAHLTRAPIGLRRRWLGRSRRWLRSRRGLVIAGLATVALGVGLWLGFAGPGSGPEPGTRVAHGVGAEAAARLDSPASVSPDDESLTAIAYPMPGGPFRDQAKAPCGPNGARWRSTADAGWNSPSAPPASRPRPSTRASATCRSPRPPGSPSPSSREPRRLHDRKSHAPMGTREVVHESH